MSLASEFPEITREREPLAPYTHLKIGGPADYFVEPRSVQELSQVLLHCKKQQIPLRMLGGGYNLLVREHRIQGAVLRLHGAAFSFLEIHGRMAKSGGGTNLSDLIAETVKAGLGGLETLVGIRGSVGGSVRCNVGDRTGEIGSSVRRVAVLTEDGVERLRGREELTFADHRSDLDEAAILWVEFELEQTPPETLLKRMRKAWVTRKASEPMSFQTGVRMFRNPVGTTAAALIERANMSRVRIGGAELCERNVNYVIANPGTTAQDILQLIEDIRVAVKQKTGVSLDQELHVW